MGRALEGGVSPWGAPDGFTEGWASPCGSWAPGPQETEGSSALLLQVELWEGDTTPYPPHPPPPASDSQASAQVARCRQGNEAQQGMGTPGVTPLTWLLPSPVAASPPARGRAGKEPLTFWGGDGRKGETSLEQRERKEMVLLVLTFPRVQDAMQGHRTTLCLGFPLCQPWAGTMDRPVPVPCGKEGEGGWKVQGGSSGALEASWREGTVLAAPGLWAQRHWDQPQL